MILFFKGFLYYSITIRHAIFSTFLYKWPTVLSVSLLFFFSSGGRQLFYVYIICIFLNSLIKWPWYPFHIPMVVTYPNILTKNRWPLACKKILKIVRSLVI